MGVNLTQLLKPEPIDLSKLRGKIVAIDTSLFLYQFLTSIRQRDGSPLTDSKGRITSHLIGLFSRTTLLMKKNIKLAYVFDGEPPKLKSRELQRRKEIKIESKKKFDEAKKREDEEAMRKYASRTSRLTPEIIEQAKEVITLLGIPCVQAPSEAEAQAAYIVKNNDAYAVASQDTDCLLYGAPRIVRNLSLTGKRKQASKLAYTSVQPEIIELSEVLNTLGIDQKQLIVVGLLVGTDFNNGGIKGIGPKTAVKLVKEFGKNFEGLFSKIEWSKFFDVSWQEVFEIIEKMPVTDKYRLLWKPPDVAKITELLVGEYGFSEQRVEASLSGLNCFGKKEKGQKGIGDFL